MAASGSSQAGAGTAGTHEFEVVDTELLVDAPILALRRDQVRMPGGKVSAREIVEHFGAVAVVVVDDQQRVCLLHQWRQAAGCRLNELPAGLLDAAGEDPLESAQRELQEEAGFSAAKWDLLVDMFTSPGFAEECVRIYLAQDLTAVERPEVDDEEADMEQFWVPLPEAIEMIVRGEITNAICISGLMTANQVLNHGATARSVDEPFELRRSTLAERRSQGQEPGTDLKRVR